MRSFLTFFFYLFLFSGAHGLTLFVQTPTAAGAPALVVWTRDATVDGSGELRFDLRFVSTGNATASASSSNTTAAASASTTAAASSDSPTPTTATGSTAAPTQENSFVVQARADGGSSTTASGAGADAGLALANIRLVAGASAGSANVFFPASGQYVVTAVTGSPSNTPIGTSNSITVTESTAVTAAAASGSATPSSSAPTPTTAPALTTITPSATATPSSSDHASPVSAAASRKHANLPAIIGGVLGTLVALALIATLVFLVGRRRALREKRRLTFHREWMVQSSESVRNLNANGGGSDAGHAESESGHGHGGMAGVGAALGRNTSTGSNSNGRTRANTNTNTAGLLVPPSPFICVTPPPEDDLETGLARNTVASSRRAAKKLRLHMYTNDTDASPTASPTTTTPTTNHDGSMPLPAGAAPPTMYTPTMLANARNVATSLSTGQNGGIAMPTPMRQTSTTPVTTLARMSSIHAHPGASPMGPRAPSPSPAVTVVTPTSPFPPQLPPLNLGFENGAYATYEAGADGGRKPPASAPARSMSFPVKTVTTVRTEAAVARAATIPSKGKGPIINTLATRPASPRLHAASTSGASASVAATTPTPANRKTPRQHVLAARLAILQNQMAEILSAPDSVHSNMVLADMRRQAAWIAEHMTGEWALGRSDERPAGWARVMTP